MIKLGVNIDHVATIRQARHGREPDPIWAAGLAETAGADGITVHLREDRRHIQDRDVRILRETVRTRLNLEMSVSPEIVKIAVGIKPDMATLVPERRQEVTTEGGLDAAGQVRKIKEAVRRLRGEGICVSLFIDPMPKQVDAAAESKAEFVEFHTGAYADAVGDLNTAGQLEKLFKMSEMARKLGLRVNAGHGISYWNVGPLVRMAGLEEFNIGHGIISRAVLVGIGQAVSEMKRAIRDAEIFYRDR